MTILQALDRYYDRMERRGEVVAPGWSTEPIGVVLILEPDGRLRSVSRRLDARGKPLPTAVPKWFSRSGIGSTPNFLWDNAAYVLGLGAKDPGKTQRDHAAFKALHAEALAEDDDPGLRAVRLFVENWSPEQGLPENLDEKLLAFNIAFQLAADQGLVHERPAAHSHIERLRQIGSAALFGFCLVRGERLPLVRLHPKIKGLDGAASAEIPLVSFNAAAFESYGKEQGFNAPTSDAAAFRYGAALSALLARGGRNRLRIADASVAFWADTRAHDAAAAEAAARAVEDAFADTFDDTPRPKATSDEQEATTLHRALRAVTEGRPQPGITADLLGGVPFHVLGLAPNVARVAVRYWLSGSFAQFASALDDHAESIRIEPSPWGTKPPAIQRLLLRTTALLEKYENVPSGLASEVMRSVLTPGLPYPRAWLAATIIRLRAGDDPGRGWHAAAIKACLSRMKKEKTSVPIGLQPDFDNVAYQLGRLFAVLEGAQRTALGRINATITDRYYAAASATPARVFGTLLRSAQRHVSDANKRNQGLWIGKKLDDIMARLPPDLPRTLRLEDQGRFAVGYYHERAHRPAKAEEAIAQDEETP